MDKEKYLGRLRGLITQLERTEKKIERRRVDLAGLEKERDALKHQIKSATLDDLDGPQTDEA